MIGIWLMLLVSLFTWLVSRRGVQKLPPGPMTVESFGDARHKSLAMLAKTHGPVMSLKIAGKTVIVVSSSAGAEQVLRHQDLNFCNRSVHDVVVNTENHSQLSVMFLPVGTKWNLLRKAMTTHVFSCSRLDATQRLRSQKVRDLVAFCKKSCEAGDAVDIGEAGFMLSLNILSNVIFSEDWLDGKEFKELVWGILSSVSRFSPVTKYDSEAARVEAGLLVVKLLEMFSVRIAQRLESRMLGTGLSMDFLDDLLALGRQDPVEINESVIQHLFMDMFIAGTDSVSATLEWAMTELLRNPRTMKKAQTELGEVIGRGKQIDDTDLPNLPYLQCVLKESLRMHPSVPLLMPHRAERDAEVCGYVVPGGSEVIVNMWAIGRDEKTWEEPLTFKPERFLELGRDFSGQDFELIPFGSGRRMCPGLPLAARAIPVALGSLLNMFNWKLDEGIVPEEIDMEEKFAITLQKAQPLRAIPVALS